MGQQVWLMRRIAIEEVPVFAPQTQEESKIACFCASAQEEQAPMHNACSLNDSDADLANAA
jgi:hypothetical protein